MKGDVGGVFGLETEGYECTGHVVKMLNCARLYLDEKILLWDWCALTI